MHQFVKYENPPFLREYYSKKFNTNDDHLPFSWGNEKTIYPRTIKNLKKVFNDKVSDTYLESLSKWKGNPFTYIIYKNAVWRTFLVPNTHTNYYPEKSISALKNIFSDLKEASFLTEDYLQAILDRRDQVLLAYQEQKK